MEKGELSYTVGGNVNWYNHYGEQYESSLRKPKTELPYNPAVPLLSIYLEKTIIRKDTCPLVFIAALFTIASTWKQLNYPLTEEQIKMWYNAISLSHEKEQSSAICSNMDGPRDYHTEQSKSGGERTNIV